MKSYKLISRYSDFPTEQEFLAPPGTRFRVRRVYRSPNPKASGVATSAEAGASVTNTCGILGRQLGCLALQQPQSGRNTAGSQSVSVLPRWKVVDIFFGDMESNSESASTSFTEFDICESDILTSPTALVPCSARRTGRSKKVGFNDVRGKSLVFEREKDGPNKWALCSLYCSLFGGYVWLSSFEDGLLPSQGLLCSLCSTHENGFASLFSEQTCSLIWTPPRKFVGNLSDFVLFCHWNFKWNPSHPP